MKEIGDEEGREKNKGEEKRKEGRKTEGQRDRQGGRNISLGKKCKQRTDLEETS